MCDIGKLLLRLNIGILMLLHGLYKLSSGIDAVKMLISNIGMPSFMAYGVYVGEILAPIMIILGFRVKIATILIIATMLVAIFTTTGGNIFALSKTGGWIIELQALYLFGALSIFFLDSGKYALDLKK